ncbi:MAG TPA: arabinan endo-1,5-alpha-L-arabinosidase [Polyangiaceae bacterium]|nr:arabinan endo-1,5-alpha-L-arabinosidase [Polyangiaceae bacterium]
MAFISNQAIRVSNWLCLVLAWGAWSCSERQAAPELAAISAELTTVSGPSADVTATETTSTTSSVTVLDLTGDVRAHDPALTRHGAYGDWYVFSTGDAAVGGGAIQIRRSTDLRNWTFAGTVFDAIPAWVSAAVPGVTNLWAPEITYRAGLYYLYYSGSTFGSNNSVIGLATNTTLNPSDPNYQWVDQGMVFRSSPANDYNAIDPAFIQNTDGTPWLAFGSFWSGIRMIRLEWPSGKAAPSSTEPLRLADRFVPPNAIEAPYILYRGGWFYLFVSLDFCCQGTNSTYKIAVGRSRQATGPYFDRLGTPMAHGGGTVILSERGDMFGPGGQSLFGGYMAHHWYDAANNGEIRLGIRRLAWDLSGWPKAATDWVQ